MIIFLPNLQTVFIKIVSRFTNIFVIGAGLLYLYQIAGGLTALLIFFVILFANTFLTYYELRDVIIKEVKSGKE